jgi:hypothetical protein
MLKPGTWQAPDGTKVYIPTGKVIYKLDSRKGSANQGGRHVRVCEILATGSLLAPELVHLRNLKDYKHVY